MKLNFRKFLSSILVLMMMISVFAVFETTEADAATSCIKKLSEDATYSYDLDRNKSKEKIKFIRVWKDSENFTIKLYINNKYVTSLDDSYYGSYDSDAVRIFDFYSKDKSKEIYLEGGDVNKIVKYNKGKYIIKTIKDCSMLYSYNSSTGIVQIYRNFDDNVLMNGCSLYKVSGYSITKQPINYGMNADMLTMRYKALKTIKAYKSPTSSKVSYTIKKGDIVYIYATYVKGSKKYLRVHTKSGKEGWVKVSSVSKVPASMFKNIGYPRS